MRPNSSFKPNLLRSTKAMAEKACHGFGSTTQVGLTQVLAAHEDIRSFAASAIDSLKRIRQVPGDWIRSYREDRSREWKTRGGGHSGNLVD